MTDTERALLVVLARIAIDSLEAPHSLRLEVLRGLKAVMVEQGKPPRPDLDRMAAHIEQQIHRHDQDEP